MTARQLPFILAASDYGPMIVSRLDFAQNAHGYYGVGFQILHKGSYDEAEINAVLSILRGLHSKRGDGIVVLDCGANVGVHTLSMAKEMLEWGKVYAYEPQERLYYALCGNIALGNFFNAHATLAAIGRTSGTIDIPRPDYTRSGSLGSLEMRFGPNVEHIGQTINYAPGSCDMVPLIAIDDMNLPRVDFIKLDVEGMELEALEGAKGTILRDHPTLLVEWIKTGAAEIRDVLIPLGYVLKEMGGNLLAEFSNV